MMKKRMPFFAVLLLFTMIFTVSAPCAFAGTTITKAIKISSTKKLDVCITIGNIETDQLTFDEVIKSCKSTTSNSNLILQIKTTQNNLITSGACKAKNGQTGAVKIQETKLSEEMQYDLTFSSVAVELDLTIEHSHVYDQTEEREGKTVQVCACGAVKPSEEPVTEPSEEPSDQPTHEHSWKETERKKPTCTEPGSVKSVCEGCSQEKTETLPALGHSLKDVKESASSCKEQGLKAHKVCERCSALFTSDAEPTPCAREDLLLPLAEHSYGDWTVSKQPTCTEGGEKQKVCAVCGDTVTDLIALDPNAHRYGDWKIVKAASCTETGIQERVCANSAEHIERSVIEQLPHTLVPVEKAAPGCETAGTEGHYRCTVCGGLFRDEAGTQPVTPEELVIGKTGHEWSAWETLTEPSCTETGSRQRGCAVCEKTETEEIPIDPNAHAYEPGEILQEPSCTVEGVRGLICSRNPEHVSRESIAPLGHVIELLAAKAPNCSESGWTEHYACTRCGAAFRDKEGTEPLPEEEWYLEPDESKHLWDNGTVIREADCGYEGKTLFTCKKDSSHMRTETTPALGHTMIPIAAVEPDCETIGCRAGFFCERCKRFYADEAGSLELSEDALEIAALGHDWDEGTEDEDGNLLHRCRRNAEHTWLEEVPKIQQSIKVLRNETWKQGMEEPISFLATREGSDSRLLDHFKEALVDNKSLPAETYGLMDDGTLYLKGSFLAAQLPGEHTLSLVFDDTDPLEAKFSVEGDQLPEPEKEPEPQAPQGHGDGGEWSQGEETPLRILYKRERDDHLTFSHFKGLLMDAREVPVDGYSAYPGSVEIWLKASYLSTLSVGEHELTLLFDDSDPASVPVRIHEAKESQTEQEVPTEAPARPESTPAPVPTPKPTSAPTPTTTPVPAPEPTPEPAPEPMPTPSPVPTLNPIPSKSPKTGDSPMLFWPLLMLLSAAGCVVALKAGRKVR